MFHDCLKSLYLHEFKRMSTSMAILRGNDIKTPVINFQDGRIQDGGQLIVKIHIYFFKKYSGHVRCTISCSTVIQHAVILISIFSVLIIQNGGCLAAILENTKIFFSSMVVFGIKL